MKTNLILLLAAGLTLSACTKEKETIKEVPSTVTILVNDKVDAESLAKAAEQLISPYTFMLADRAATMALEKDPTNLRAQFYKQFLKQFMAYKGILNRVKPFARTYGDIQKLEHTIKSIPKSALKDFLTDGAEDISDYTGIQNVLVASRDGANDFRKFLRANPDFNMEINLNPHVFSANYQDFSNNCVIVEKPDGGFEAQCDFTNAFVRKMTPADTLALSQLVSSQLLYWMFYTNYGVEGIEKLVKQDPEGKLTPAQRQAILESNPNFGKLRNDHNFKLLSELGADASAAWKYFAKFQKELCPETNSNVPWYRPQKRPGHLFTEGICVQTDDQAYQAVAQLDHALNGVIQLAMKTADGGEAVIALDAFLISKKPIQNLRSIAPATYNKCNEVSSIRDNTLGGILPNAQAQLFIKQDCKN